MPLRSPNSASRTAFTLVELVVVVFILGILTAAAVPTFASSLMYHRVESAARRLKSDLELARRMAVTRSTTYSLEFTTATAYALPNVASLDDAGQAYRVDLAESPYGVSVTSVDFGGNTSVSFNGYGLPSSGGTVAVQAGDHARQVALGAQGNVTISPF